MMHLFAMPDYNLTTVKQPVGKILFREEQLFRQSWGWRILSGSLLLALVGLLIGFLTSKGHSVQEGASALLIVLVLTIINFVILYGMKLETIITDEGVFYRWRPFRKKYTILNWSSIQQVIVKKYPYLQFGSHYRSGFGKVHNIKGNRGIQFILTDKKRIYLGTQRIAAMQHALESIRHVDVETK